MINTWQLTSRGSNEDFEQSQNGLSTSSKNANKATFYSPIDVRATPAPTSKLPVEREIVTDSGCSMLFAEQKRFELRRNGHFEKVQNPYHSDYGKWGSANKWRSTGKVHDLGFFVTVQILEGHACCSVARKALRRTPIFKGVGQRSKNHGRPQKKKTFCKTKQFRTSCRSRSILQQWYKFVFNTVFTGLVIDKSGHRTK